MLTGATDIRELPGIIPIFPLGGILLLPRAQLPLHIFEPRYRAMTRDAMANDHAIGMIQPIEGDAPSDNPRVYPTGCLGVIDECKETEDGRYFLTLKGLCRFRIVEELPLLRGYRRVVPDYAPYSEDLAEPRRPMANRQRLMLALTAYLKIHGLSADWDAIKGAPDEPLINALAMACPFAPSEKQALLECPDVVERSRVLTALCEMGALGGPDDSKETGQSPVRH